MKTAKEFLIEKGFPLLADYSLMDKDGHYRGIAELLDEYLKENLSLGLQLIAAERERVLTVEGFTPEQDDSYTEGQLARAAVCYASEGRELRAEILFHAWPWHVKYWKPTPKYRIKELVKAGGLIVAEIERLKRLQEPKSKN